MSIMKTFQFAVDVRSSGGPLAVASAPGKPTLKVATPPEFKGGIAGVWSPEDLLVGATATCFATTFAAVARRRGVAVETLHVAGLGHLEKRVDGRLGFVAIELAVEVEAPGTEPKAVEDAARYAERACLVADALDVPVRVEVTVRGAEPALAV